MMDRKKAADLAYAEGYRLGSASRDAEVAELKRELDNEQARDIHSCHPNCSREGCVNRRLRAELAAAIAACKVKDEALNAMLERFGIMSDGCIKQASIAIAIQPDDSALKAWLGEPVAEVDDSGVVIVCRYDYKPKDKFYSPKGLK
jgi:hypothetical protein